MKDFILFHNKISFINAGSKISLNSEDNQFFILIKDLKQFGFVELLKKLINSLKAQILVDEKYWDKYFKFQNDDIE
jgi:hypothetical protein